MNKRNTYVEIIEKNKILNFVKTKINIENQNIQGPLSKYCYVIKDNICTKDIVTTAGSLFLENFIPPYNATVISLLNDAGAVPIAKTNLDEFGMGGTGTFCAYGIVLNPWNTKCISGGSSSGSAVATAIKACDFALGTDTGDSIRKPASFNGIIGYKPTYGLISRYGVIPYAPSLDHVGLFARSFKVIFDVMKVIAREDNKDFSSQNASINFSFVNLDVKKLKICVLNEMYNDLDENVKNLFEKTLKLLDSKINKVDFSQELIEAIPGIYQIITYSEAVSCYQSFSGITFGKKEKGKTFEDIARKTRTKYFGSEIKRRFTIGAYCTAFKNYEELFQKSKKVRTLLNQRARTLLSENHFIISVGSSTTAPLIEDILSKKYKDIDADNILQIANFGGFPSITIPMGKIKGMPIGINITSRINSDQYLLSFAKIFLDLIRKANFNE